MANVAFLHEQPPTTDDTTEALVVDAVRRAITTRGFNGAEWIPVSPASGAPAVTREREMEAVRITTRASEGVIGVVNPCSDTIPDQASVARAFNIRFLGLVYPPDAVRTALLNENRGNGVEFVNCADPDDASLIAGAFLDKLRTPTDSTLDSL